MTDFAVMLGQYIESGVALDQAIPAAAKAAGMETPPTIAEVRGALASLQNEKQREDARKIDYKRLTR